MKTSNLTLDLKHHITIFAALLFLTQTAASLSYSFIIPYVGSLGFSGAQTGLTESLMAAAGIAGQFIISYFCDKKGKIKVFYLAISVFLSVFVIITYSHSFPFIVAICLTTTMGLLYNTLISLGDSWVLESGDKIMERFGLIRAAGSLGWAISSVVLGMLIAAFGYRSISVVMMFAGIAIFFVARSLPDAVKHSTTKITFASLKELSSNRKYTYLLFTYFSLFCILAAEWMLVPMKLSQIGGASSLGIFYGIQAVTEIPAMIIYSRLSTYISNKKLLILGILFYIMRVFLFGIATSVPEFWILALSAGITFAPVYIGAKYIFDEVIPSHLKTTGQMMALATYMGGAGIFSPPIFGIIVDKFSINIALITASSLGVIPITLAIIYSRTSKR